jgi:hypothetical protein
MLDSAHELRKLRQLIARQEIYDAMMRYCRGVDHGDEELALSAFHPGATDDHGPYRGTVEGFIARSMKNQAHNIRHIIANHYVEFDDDDENVAYSESVSAGALLHKTGAEGFHVALHCCRILDRFECRDGQWKIVDRRVVLDFSVEGPVLGQNANDTTDGMLVGVRGLSDPSFGLGFRHWGDKTYPPVSEKRAARAGVAA